MSRTLTSMESTVDGIPCLIVVTSWDPYVPARLSGSWETSEPASGGCGEWYVADQDGRPAAWLEAKLTASERRRIEEELFNRMEGEER